MRTILLLAVALFTCYSCVDEDPSSRMNLNFNNTNYVIDASKDVVITEVGGLNILADSENFTLEIMVNSYNGVGTYANDEIEYKVTFEGVEYFMPTTFRNFIVHNDTPTLFSGQYDFRQPDNVTNDQYFAVGSFYIER